MSVLDLQLMWVPTKKRAYSASNLFIFLSQRVSAILWGQWVAGVTRRLVSACVDEVWPASGVTAVPQDMNRGSLLYSPAYVSLPATQMSILNLLTLAVLSERVFTLKAKQELLPLFVSYWFHKV